MSAELQALAVTFLRGTARAELRAPQAGPLGDALARIERPTPEQTLLARAAVAGLYAQAGRLPAAVQTPAPVFVVGEPETRRPVPPALLALLPRLMQQPDVLSQALVQMVRAGLTLPAPEALPLLGLQDGGTDTLSGTLWTLLDDHGRWLARLNPEWKRHDPAIPPEALRRTRLRRELVEAHAASPEQTAADIVARWPSLKADERRVALGAAAGSLMAADWPLILLAMNDKLPDVRRRARLLQGHLPGEVQDAVRAALPGWFRLAKGRLKVDRGGYVEALGQPEANTTADGELHRLLGALPLAELPGLLGIHLPEIRTAIGKAAEHVGSTASEYRGRKVIEDMERSAAAGADLDTLLAFESGLDGLLENWPQRRLQALLWEAVTRLLGQPELDRALMRITLTLFAALEDPLPLAPETQATPRKGLLARIASALSRPQAQDWPTLLNALSERLLLALSREVSSYPLPLSPLLTAMYVHLDPARPDPTFQEAQLSENVPQGSAGEQEEQNARATLLYSQQVSAQTSLTHTLALRRQVRAALAGEQ